MTNRSIWDPMLPPSKIDHLFAYPGKKQEYFWRENLKTNRHWREYPDKYWGDNPENFEGFPDNG